MLLASRGRRHLGENGEIGRLLIQRRRRSPSEITAARSWRIASPEGPSFQNFSVPLTRLLICLTRDSARELVEVKVLYGPW